MQLLIKNIILYDDRMEITFNYTRNRSTENESRGLVVHEGDYTLGEGSEYATDMQVRLKFWYTPDQPKLSRKSMLKKSARSLEK